MGSCLSTSSSISKSDNSAAASEHGRMANTTHATPEPSPIPEPPRTLTPVEACPVISEQPEPVVKPLTISDHTQVSQSNSFFENAHDILFYKPIMAEQVAINQPVSLDNESMKWLCAHTMQGVEHCSDAREPPPRCHPETRLTLLTEINNWLRDESSKLRLLLLCGPAGVGKSAISQSLADCAAKENRLGATLFFTSSSRERPKFWTTISYLLAVNHNPYRRHVHQKIGHNHKLVEHNMEEQFDVLVREPIGRQNLLEKGSHLIPIFIDGLDQFCGPDERKQVVQLIIDFVQEHPDAPLAWIVTSRIDEHLITFFDHSGTVQERVGKRSIGIDSDDARTDVLRFLKGRFREIQQRYAIPEPPPWPEMDELEQLSTTASGFFTFAHAAVRFVDDREAEDPEGQLNVFLSVISAPADDPLLTIVDENDPLDTLHGMYKQILDNVSRRHRDTAKRIMGFYLLPEGFGSWSRDTTTFWVLCNILGIRKKDGYLCLSGLHSLLDIPKMEDATLQPVRFFHGSFANYLVSQKCPANFRIDMKEVMSDLWHCHFLALQNAQEAGHSTIQLSNIPLSWSLSPELDQNFCLNLWENARRLFFHYLIRCDPLRCPFGLHHTDLSDPENSPELVKILRQVHFDNLIDGYAFPDLPFKLLEFLDWIVQEGSSLLEQEDLLKPLSITDQRFDWIRHDVASFGACTVTLSTSEAHGHITSFKTYIDQACGAPAGMNSSQLISTREPPAPFSDLFNNLATHQNKFSAAFVVGSEEGGQCALLIDTSNPEYKFYYVLPYDPTLAWRRPN